MDLPFKFCKIGLKNTLFIFGRKNCRLLLLFACLFICLIVVAIFLSDFGLLFFKTLFKGKHFAVRRVREARGKFDFDHYFTFLNNFLKR